MRFRSSSPSNYSVAALAAGSALSTDSNGRGAVQSLSGPTPLPKHLAPDFNRDRSPHSAE